MPTQRQIKTLNNLMQNDNVTIKDAMLDAGYSIRSAENRQVSRSKFVNQRIEQMFPVDFYKKSFEKLFKGGKIESFRVAKDAGQKEIAELKQTIEQFGGGWIGMQKTPMGSFAFYFMPDLIAIDKALDKVFKLSGNYASEKIEITQPAQVVGVRFVDAEPKRIALETQEIADSDAVNENNEGMPRRADFHLYAPTG